jgi:HAD superfamily hydrolase (TIGR01456 family)
MLPVQANFSGDFLIAFKRFVQTRDREAMETLPNGHIQITQATSIKPKTPNKKIAFAFDIDGVLVGSKVPLPGATETLKFLQRHKISFVFITNRGGATEKDQVADLSQLLSLPNLSERQFIQSHTPFRELVPSLADNNILVLGGVRNRIREIARAYGFKHILDSDTAYCSSHGPDIITSPRGLVQISAILVWTTPRDWGRDIQLVMDILLSEKGYLGTVSPLNGDDNFPNRGYLQDEQPVIYFSSSDPTWVTSCSRPRPTQGIFKAALEGVWTAKTQGAKLLNCEEFGKPTEEMFVFGEKALVEWETNVNGGEGKIDTVYMVGDTPVTDIQGASNFHSRHGIEWNSILVETGFHIAGEKPAHKPNIIVKGVKEAIEWALKDSGLDVID